MFKIFFIVDSEKIWNLNSSVNFANKEFNIHSNLKLNPNASNLGSE
jgi:hypothetical protein